MENLIRHIDYLMSRNDCVIIPGIGAILARYVSAHVDTANGVVYPPHREFSFNSALVYNDGMLAHSYVRSMEITYESALAKINDASAKLEAVLNTNGHVALGRIGSLTLTDGTIDFLPAPDTFALSHLPIVEYSSKPHSAVGVVSDFAEEASMKLRMKQRVRQAARIAASIALLIGICFVASTPIKVDDAALASLSPEFKQATIEDIMAVDECEQPETYTINVSGTNGEYLAFEAPIRPVRASASSKKYYLIVGSFNTTTEANKFIEMNADKNLGRLDSPTRYRVFAGVYNTAADALDALKSTDFKSTGAWISHQ